VARRSRRRSDTVVYTHPCLADPRCRGLDFRISFRFSFWVGYRRMVADREKANGAAARSGKSAATLDDHIPSNGDLDARLAEVSADRIEMARRAVTGGNAGERHLQSAIPSLHLFHR